MFTSKTMRGLFSTWDAIESCTWPVAERYVVYDGKIRPDSEAGGWKNHMLNPPLADPNLFLSFARLGHQGANLSENAILRWIGKRGLLQLKDPDVGYFDLENHRPITLREFREEARRACETLTLLSDIRTENYDALRSRISYVPNDIPNKSGEGRCEDVYVDGRPIPWIWMAESEHTDRDVRFEAMHGLEDLVASKLKGVNLDFDNSSGHPRPQDVYRPKLIVRIPDLQRAVWYQFACLMTDTRHTKFCEVCEGPIFRPRKNQKTCSDACRTKKSRWKKSHRG